MFEFFKRKKKKTIKLFVVTKDYRLPEGIEDSGKLIFYTLTSTLAEAEEYINKRLFIENKQHFKQWSELKGLDYLSLDAWELYVSTGTVDFTKYIISEASYEARDIATIFRIYNNCIPIGTSYEEDIELYNILNVVPDEVAEALKNHEGLKEVIDEIKKQFEN